MPATITEPTNRVHVSKWINVMSYATGAKTAEIDRNLAAFIDLLPSLLKDHQGEYVLMRNASVLGFFDSAIAAQIAGNQKFADHIFSIQHVKNTVEELGYLSYAQHTRTSQ